ncbi:MAG: hypothetical protein DRP35_00905 [Candidatus Zixiibacteriota bacterium]|nr:MAG: hypothetical protein DRP35_00905 [candidate division Zixibacteria bacterium]
MKKKKGIKLNLKSLIANIRISRMKKKVETTVFNFPSALDNPKNILVCLPCSLRELTIVKEFLPIITEMFKNAKITLLPTPGIKVSDMYPRKGFIILSPTSDQLTWAGLPKKNYLTNLQSNKFDMILDLNFEESSFISGILLSFPDALRVGKGNHLGKSFYNLEIKTKFLRDERNIYRSIFDTLSVLKGNKAQTA